MGVSFVSPTGSTVVPPSHGVFMSPREGPTSLPRHGSYQWTDRSETDSVGGPVLDRPGTDPTPTEAPNPGPGPVTTHGHRRRSDPRPWVPSHPADRWVLVGRVGGPETPSRPDRRVPSPDSRNSWTGRSRTPPLRSLWCPQPGPDSDGTSGSQYPLTPILVFGSHPCPLSPVQ